MPGKLYLVATPIGNMEDITLRAIRVLTEADLIAAEDSRRTLPLTQHYHISTPITSYHEHNKHSKGPWLVQRLLQGDNVALVSDAGTPCLSDPGQELVEQAITAGIEVICLPGASALLTLLPISGLMEGAFCFEGFLPREKKERRERLRQLAGDERPTVFYEAPHRLRAMLEDVALVWGRERPAVIGRELTKYYEEVLRGTIGELLDHFQSTEPRGEFILAVAGAAPPIPREADWEQVRAELEELLATGLSRKEAARRIADKNELRVNQVYQLGLKDTED